MLANVGVRAVSDTAGAARPSALRADLDASHNRYSPPKILIATMSGEYVSSAADTPSTATLAHNIELDRTPSENVNAAFRP